MSRASRGPHPPRSTSRSRHAPTAGHGPTPEIRPGRAERATPEGHAVQGRLRSLRYFGSLPPAEIRRLAASCIVRRLGPGQALFEEGAPCEGLFIVDEGTVEMRQVSLAGREQVFHTEGPGTTLAEGPLFDGGSYIASAVALSETRVLVLPRVVVLELCRRHPDVALAMLETLAGRMRRFAELIADLAFRRVSERVARHLEVASTGRSDGEVPLPLTHAQLAARLGTVRELVARALGQLEKDGIIARARSVIVIRDRARLAARARGEPNRGL